MKRKIILAIAFVLTASLFGYIGLISADRRCNDSIATPGDQVSLNKVVSPEDLKKDYAFYRETMTNLHPGLYAWHSKKEFEALFDSVGALLDTSITRAQFYTYLNIIANRIGCSHTEVDFYGDYRESGFFPFPIVSIDNAYYSTCTSCDVPKGSKLLSINGEKMETIAQRLLIYESVDGCSPYVSLQKVMQNFPLKYFLAFGKKYTFEITYEEVNTKNIKSVAVDGVSSNYISAADWHPFWFNHFDYDFKLMDSLHIAVLKLRTFSYDKGMKTEGYENFIKNAFRLLSLDRSYKNLVIDLRNNLGGQDMNCYLLYSYLARKDFYTDSTAYMNGFEFPSHDVLGGNSSTFLDSIRSADYQPNGDTTKFKLIPSKAKKWFVSRHAFRGNVYVITNSVTSSASVRLTSLLQLNDSAKIVGEIPEGIYSGATAYYNKEYLLSSSYISFTVPLVNIKYNVPLLARHSPELIPDYRIPLNQQDFIDDKDTQLEFILKSLIKN